MTILIEGAIYKQTLSSCKRNVQRVCRYALCPLRYVIYYWLEERTPEQLKGEGG
jgi:hypothetical protein